MKEIILSEKQTPLYENKYRIVELKQVNPPYYEKIYTGNTLYISLISEQDFDIYYTIDGSEPKECQLKYENPITVNKEITIKAVCVNNSIFSECISEEFLREIIPINKILQNEIIFPETINLNRAYPIQEPLFISIIQEEPYKEPSDFFRTKSFSLTGSSDYEVFFEEERIYLFFQKKYFEHVELRIENESGLGTSLYVSEVDQENNPIRFKKKLVFKDIDGTTNPVKIPLMVRWEMINNKEVVKNINQNSFLNIYEIEREK